LADSDDELNARLEAALEPHSPARGPYFRWDEWSISGGDSDQALHVRGALVHDARIVRNPSYRMTLPEWRCAGGPKWMLDLDTDRNAVFEAARRYWERWWEWARSGPLAPAYEYLVDPPAVDHDMRGRRDYMIEPAVRAWLADGGDDAPQPWFADWNGVYGHDREEYARLASQRVNPTDALLQLDGRWLDDDDFGARSDHRRFPRYYAYADDYLLALPDDCWIVRLSVHY
jgi:hypothetical protein